MFDFIENNCNKIIKWSVVICLLAVSMLLLDTKANYKFEKDYMSNWTLAEKSSTLEAKSVYLSKFLDSLKGGYENGNFSSHNALFLKTDDNSFSKNLEALETLNSRLKEISTIDPNSFQYNTAIQQITAQEQGEAWAMLDVFEGCYYMSNYPYLWGWIGMGLFGVFSWIGGCGLLAGLTFKLFED